MKSAKEWVDEYSQSGAFDLVMDCRHAEEIVAEIQEDAIDGYTAFNGPVWTTHE
jgi:hypothetical protein